MGRQKRQPGHQQLVKSRLADFDWGIAPDHIEGALHQRIRRSRHGDVLQSEASGIIGSELSGPLIDIHGPHLSVGSTLRHRESNRAGPTAEIEKVAGLGKIRSLHQQDLAAGIETTMGKNSGVSLHLEGEIGKLHANSAPLGAHRWLGVEVVGHVGVAHEIGSLSSMSYQIRTFGDPVLATEAGEVTEINGKIVRIVDEMFETLYASDSGIGLAAPQVGIQRQIFVWDMDDDPRVIINPKIVESDGEWVYDEGCLSIPGLFVEMTRPKTVLMTGVDLDGNDISVEADELEARLFQHELDHLNGVLMFDRMQPDQRQQALAEYKRLVAQGTALGEPVRLSAE